MGLWIGQEDKQLQKAAIEILGTESMAHISNSGEQVGLYCKYGSFVLTEVSGPVVASVGLQVHKKYQRQGWAGKFDEVKRRWCEMAGVELMIATVRHDNEAEIASIQKCGWTKVGDLKDVGIWVTKPDHGFPDISYLT